VFVSPGKRLSDILINQIQKSLSIRLSCIYEIFIPFCFNDRWNFIVIRPSTKNIFVFDPTSNAGELSDITSASILQYIPDVVDDKIEKDLLEIRNMHHYNVPVSAISAIELIEQVRFLL
jgi:hypothetical protein